MNLDKQIQNLLCYHYTIGQTVCFATKQATRYKALAADSSVKCPSAVPVLTDPGLPNILPRMNGSEEGAQASSPRRPIKARNSRWAAAVAVRLAHCGVRPNTISAFSVVFAAGAGLCVVLAGSAGPLSAPLLFLVAAACIQGRLLCNLFDGMVAVEGGLKTKSGEIFNDMPDRIADPLVLVPVGYACADLPAAVALGWLAGLLAVLTAYVRVLAGSAGAPQRFLGPMAKQHRMALMTAALAIAAGLHRFGLHPRILFVALLGVVFGCVVTVVLRLVTAVRDLESR